MLDGSERPLRLRSRCVALRGALGGTAQAALAVECSVALKRTESARR